MGYQALCQEVAKEYGIMLESPTKNSNIIEYEMESNEIELGDLIIIFLVLLFIFIDGYFLDG